MLFCASLFGIKAKVPLTRFSKLFIDLNLYINLTYTPCPLHAGLILIEPPGSASVRPAILRHRIELFKSLEVFGESVLNCTSAYTFLSCDYIIAHLFLICNIQIPQSIQLFFVYFAEIRHYDEFVLDILTQM